MTFSTSYLHKARSRYAYLPIAFIFLIASFANGQSLAHFRGLGVSDVSHSVESDESGEDSCVESVRTDLGGPSAVQSETYPKPHASLQVTSETDGPAMERIQFPDTSDEDQADTQGRFKAIERYEIPRSSDPYWRPVSVPKRFVSASDEDEDNDDRATQNGHSNKFHWKPAVLQSIMIQGVQHAYAVTIQEKTRRELKGPWFKDWFRSVSHIHGWDDGNRFFTNYVAHPMQGGMTGFIFLQNHDRLKRQKFAESKTYWADRLKAMLWSAAWSTQWEIGPFSQASIGNVGLKKGMAFVDITVTPTVGTGWMITEEALDRYIIRHLEKHTNFVAKIFLRTLLNPMRGVANTLRFKPPWYRDRPFGT